MHNQTTDYMNGVLKRMPAIFFLVLLMFIFSFGSFAAPPPANDDPCNAINLNPTPTCNNYQVYSTVGATASTGVPAPGCAGYIGGDVWFKVTIPCATTLFFDTNFGVVLDGGMAIYTGTCANLTLIACDDNSSGNGNMPSITLSSLVSGTTVWVRFWSKNNATAGTFGICVTIPPPPPPGASCPTAGAFCTGSSYNFPNNTNVPDLVGDIYDCLSTTPNPVFYYMQIQNPGDLSIYITQDDASGNLIDVDFCCWGPFSSFAAICPGLSANNVVDCSYSPLGFETCTIPGAQVGEFYMLLLTNFSNDPGTIHFEQSAGTASTTCGIVCTITAGNNGPVCAGQPFNLTSNIPGGLPGATYSWTGPNCFGSVAQNPTGIIAPSTPGSYVYTVTATTPDGTSCNASTTVVVTAAPTVSATKTDETCPGLGNGTITVNPPATGGPFVYTLNPGNVVQNGNPVFTGLAVGTYTISVQPATGCAGTVSPNPVIATSSSTPTASAITAATSCSTASDGTITITPPGAGGPFIYTLNPGNIVHNNNPVYTGVAAGTYTITFSNAGGCNGSVSPNPVVLPGAALTATATPINTTCPDLDNGTITVNPPATGGPFIYTLNPGNIVHNNNPVFTGLATNTYTITVANAAGCSGNVSPNPIIQAGPALTASAIPATTTCPGIDDGTITITPPATGGPFVYTLNPGNVIHNNNPVYTGLATGTYTITFTNAAGCSGAVSPNPVVSAGPAITASALPGNTTCPSVDDGTITIAPPATGGPFEYTLNPGNIVHNNNPVYTGLASGTYTITFTNAAGCSGAVSPNTIVSAGPAITASAIPGNTTCPSVDDGTITITPPATGGPFVYTLNPGNIVHNNNPVYTGLASGTYTITFTNAAGCSGAVSPNTLVTAGPALTANTPTLINPPCANINDGSITVVPASAGVYTYVLNPGTPGEVVQPNNPTFNGLAPGTYSYNFTNAAGCMGSGNATLTTHTPLAITVVKTKPLCFSDANGIIMLNATGGLPGYQYALSPFSIFQATGTFNGLAQGSYTFRVRDAAGCTKDTTIILDEPAKLAATAVSTSGTCNGNDGTITVTGHDGTLPYTYSIDGVTYQSSQSFIVSGAASPGAAYPNVSVKDNNGCTATSTIIYVPLTDNMPPLIIGNDTTICVEQTVTFQPQVSAQATVFNWTTIPDASLSSTLDNTTILNATATPLDSATYVLNAQWGVCSRKDSITVNILHKPIPNAGKDTAVCFDRTVAILNGTATNLSGTVNYEWTDTTNLQTPHSAVTVATPPTTEVFILTVTDNYGCNFRETDRVTVVVQPPVPAYGGHDTIAVIGQQHQLTATGGVSYAWTPSNDLNFSNIPNPLATLDHDQLFQVTVTDVAGCVGKDNVYVQVYPGPLYHIPNAFSPNGDGLNDIFRVVPAGISYTEWFRIFNRFGELVFESNQWLKGWDGTFKGKKQPIGNYVWVLKGRDKNNKVVEMKGTVLIVQ
ncbi:MAG: gliding motility-associated C-terminal domain-containing protein [Ferruginibacter sp.]